MPEPFSIEQAWRSDVPAMLAISNHAAAKSTVNFSLVPEPEADWLASFDKTREMHPWLVARSNGEVIGFAKTSPYKVRGAYRFTAEVSVYIRDDWQGRGLGAALYSKMIPISRAQGYAALYAGIVDGSTASEKLHARCGFVKAGVLRGVGFKLGKWLDVGTWVLPLRTSDLAPGEVKPVAAVWDGSPQ